MAKKVFSAFNLPPEVKQAAKLLQSARIMDIPAILEHEDYEYGQGDICLVYYDDLADLDQHAKLDGRCSCGHGMAAHTVSKKPYGEAFVTCAHVGCKCINRPYDKARD